MLDHLGIMLRITGFCVGASFLYLGAVLGLSCGLFLSWAYVGPAWDYVGNSWVLFWAMLALCWLVLQQVARCSNLTS